MKGSIRISLGAVLAGTALLLGACGGDGDTENGVDTTAAIPGGSGTTAGDTTIVDTAPAVSAPEAMTDASIFAAMSMADSMEIEMGRLARERSKNADVKAYGTMMVDDHTKSRSEGKTLADKLGVTPVPPADTSMMVEMRSGMEMMHSATDAELDRMYMDHAVADHQKLLDALGMMKTAAQNDSLKMFIDKILPVVQKHLDRAREIQGKLGATASR